MLSVSRSRLALPAQLFFLGLHAVGLLLGTVYKSKTPDLYQNNAHNKIGWVVTSVVVIQCVIGFVKLTVPQKQPQEVDADPQTALLHMSTQASVQHPQTTDPPNEYRYSRDSGHYTASEASRSQSVSSMQDQEDLEHQKFLEYEVPHADTDADYTEKQGILSSTQSRFAAQITAMMTKRTTRAMNLLYNTMDYTSLPLGFVAVVSGSVVYFGVFVSHHFLYRHQR